MFYELTNSFYLEGKQAEYLITKTLIIVNNFEIMEPTLTGKNVGFSKN